MNNLSAAPDVPLGEPAWHHPFAALGGRFCVAQQPTPLPRPYWVGQSDAVAALLGLPPSWKNSEEWLNVCSGNVLPTGSKPVASVYSGHQFGVWAGQLGDGRAILLGATNGLELQLKGAGRTPFSRMGDGRAVLRSSIREFLCSEAIHGLGIPGTRALCVVGSDAPVQRETVETAAVVTRVAPSFVRFGHFEHFAHSGQIGELKVLADYVIDHFYPDCRNTGQWNGNPYVALLAEVTRRTAGLLAQWQSVGFCHGVMNTDNMSILGLTIDYGPFQFLDAYDPAHICNHSDHQGRYAFNQQPQVAWWNLYCLGHALLPLAQDQAQTEAALETFPALYQQAFAHRMAAKLGFDHAYAAPQTLVQEVLQLLATDRVDYTIFWRRLSHWAIRADLADASVRDLFFNRDAIDAWLASYGAQIKAAGSAHHTQTMLHNNPKYVLRNHLGELAIRAARAKDFSQVASLLRVLESPFEEHPELGQLADFPPDWAKGIEISCSS